MERSTDRALLGRVDFVCQVLVQAFSTGQIRAQLRLDEQVVEHEASVVMENREALPSRNDVFDRKQRTARDRGIADLSKFRLQDPQRHFINVRIEVSGDHHERVGISIEQLLHKQPSLECLSGALHAGEEETLSPATDRAPREWTKLLSCHRRSKRRAQVQIDDVE